MKLLMSINYKFMEKSPKELLDIINYRKSNLGGFEVCINSNLESEIKYLKDLAFEAKQNGLILQMHGNIYNSDDFNYKYLDIIDEVSHIMDSNINIVYHSVFKDSKEESVLTSIRFMGSMQDYIISKGYSITLSIENLNDLRNQDRLNKEDLIPILEKLPDLKFTYDIGHELIEYGKIVDLGEILLNRINNVHIHTFHNTYDHQILTDNDVHKEQWIKGITYLKLINYNETMVLEYDLYAFQYNTFEEKIIGYVESIDRIAEYFYD